MEIKTILPQLASPRSLRITPIRTALQSPYPKGLRNRANKKRATPKAITRWRSFPFGKGSPFSGSVSFFLSDRINKARLKATRKIPIRRG